MFTSSTSGKLKKGITIALVAVGLSATALLLVGCQTAKPTQPTAMSEAAMCAKCQITWVKVPHRAGKSGVVTYSTFKKMECPDCRNAVLSFFETGKFQHTCKTCGDNLEICKAH